MIPTAISAATPAVPAASPALCSRWTRLGLAGMLFFLVKGLLWLIVPALFWVRQ
jgi:hypothetical protein